MTKTLVFALWGICAAAVLTLITLPISLQTHLIAGTVVVGAMMLLKATRQGGIWRMIAIALGTSIVLRYVFWRTTSTLPPLNQPENFIPGLLLYLAEMYSVFMLFLSLFVVMMPLPSRKPPQQDDEDLPTVDVFIPTYNEDVGLLATTMAAAMAMDYPADKFTVWLLDDGGTEQKRNSEKAEDAVAAQSRHAVLQSLCESMGVRYLTRARNEHAKAGNLNNGLKHSTGELIAVFDADHAPARDFLRETVGFFAEDEKLFLVQTPHFFLNPDPLERNLRTFEKMPSENEMFYGIIQRGLDKWNAAFFCGSAAVLARKALNETGGFAGRSITEDCETALGLHSRGWNSIYVDKPLIAGLQPATFASFIGQRSRWAQGMIQILRFQFPLFKRGLTFAQRLCYMSSTLFWLFPITRAIFLIAPLFYLFFGLKIFVASGQEFLAYTSSYMIVNLIMQNYLYGSYRWPWVSDLYEYIQSIHLLPALVSVIRNPSKPTFKVTAKDESIDKARVSEIGRPFYLIFGLLVIAVAMTVHRIIVEPHTADVTVVVGGWNLLNLILVGCALGVVSERRERQRTRRITVQRRCEFLFGGEWIPATIEDVSVHGARIKLAGEGAMPTIEGPVDGAIRFTPYTPLPVTELPLTIQNIGRDEKGPFIGCRFRVDEPAHYRLVADLVFANSERWTSFQKARRVNIGLVRGTIWFYGVALYQTGRGLGYLMREIRRREDPNVKQLILMAQTMREQDGVSPAKPSRRRSDRKKAAAGAQS
ncbi:MAG: UDP-forming cellulose synthase catalytic subunit [Bauldia sp.]|nr:UDP-forming cellulose synthase catalytic subunit [Bauldia sp.]